LFCATSAIALFSSRSFSSFSWLISSSEIARSRKLSAPVLFSRKPAVEMPPVRYC
jgi:hypothetical protein